MLGRSSNSKTFLKIFLNRKEKKNSHEKSIEAQKNAYKRGHEIKICKVEDLPGKQQSFKGSLIHEPLNNLFLRNNTLHHR